MSTNGPLLPRYEDPETRDWFDMGARKMQRQFWETQADEWDTGRAGRGLQPHHMKRMTPWLSDPVLVVGAGRGLMLQALRAGGYAATGVDWSANMVAAAQRDGIVGLNYGEADRLPHDGQSMASVILSTGVLLPTHGQDRLDSYLGEAWRVLAPTGHLILCLFFEQGSAQARRAAENVKLPIHTLHAQRHWDLGPLAASLCNQGFRTLDQIEQDDILIWSLAKTAPQF